MITSGCTASTQYGYAEMLRAATDGELDFAADVREYARRAERMKKIFTDNGFHIVYDYDVTRPVGDGFFFTVGYGRMSGGRIVARVVILWSEQYLVGDNRQRAARREGMYFPYA